MDHYISCSKCSNPRNNQLDQLVKAQSPEEFEMDENAARP
jgi:hypothetical protein